MGNNVLKLSVQAGAGSHQKAPGIVTTLRSLKDHEAVQKFNRRALKR